MSWIKVETSFFRRGDLCRAGEEAQMLWLRARCLAMEVLNDGCYCRAELETLGLARLDERIAALCKQKVWRASGEDGWVDTTYLEDHPSAKHVRNLSRIRSAAARSRPRSANGQIAEQDEEEQAQNGPPVDDNDHEPGTRLPPRTDIDMRGRMAHFATEQERCHREYGPFAVEQQLDRLAHSQDVVDELGRPLTNDDLDTIVTNWLQHGQPATAMRLAGTTSTGTPWWRLCLDGSNNFSDKAKRKPEGEPLHTAYERLKARQARKEGAHAQAQ